MQKKLKFPTFEVTYWKAHGEEDKTVIVRPAPFSKLQEIKTLQQKLIEAFEEKNGSLGELLADSAVIANMKTLATMLPIVGKDKPGLDIDPLYDSGDIVQLGQIFFSESVSHDMRSKGYSQTEIDGRTMNLYNYPDHRQNPIPSAIARIHDLPFFDLLLQIRDRRRTQLIQEMSETENQESKAVAAAK